MNPVSASEKIQKVKRSRVGVFEIFQLEGCSIHGTIHERFYIPCSSG
jgi:hypothetical protein